ncbi:MAG TPA: response regulator transcription factor [Candidatus Pelethocola excrementipullorum]|nr:response regulator transcription factor [Candidatus Pelethocola excrementipullorum]
MIKITIVEDEKEYVQILQNYLKRYEEENDVKFHITVYQDGLDIVSEYKPEHDIILLDIQMKHLDGMKTAEKIRKLDEDVIFIFITSTVQFAVQGYLVDALGYVLKPVPYLAFSKIMEKAVKQLRHKQEKAYLSFEVDGGHMRLDTSLIYYIESQNHNVLIHSEKGDFLTQKPLKNIEESLSSKGFSRCHNAYLVNLEHATGIQQNNVILSEGTAVGISRARKKAFMDSLTDYIGGSNR